MFCVQCYNIEIFGKCNLKPYLLKFNAQLFSKHLGEKTEYPFTRDIFKNHIVLMTHTKITN